MRNFMKKMSADKVRAHAAESAFFILISIFPISMLLISLLKYTSIDPEGLISTLEDLVVFDISWIVEPAVNSVYRQTIALVSITALAALWAGGRSVLGLMDGLDSVYRIEKRRNYLILRLRAAAYTFLLILALAAGVFILVMGYSMQTYMRNSIRIFYYLPGLGSVISVLLIALLLFLVFWLMYAFLPNERRPLRKQLPGSAFAAVSWVVFTYAFSFFLSLSTNMSVIYGSLTTLVIVMLWLYATMYLVFVGAEINHYFMAPELFQPKEEEIIS